MAQKAKITMDELLAQEEVTPIVLGDTIDGIVMSVKKHEILIDLGARGVGMVPRREVAFGRQLKVGDEVSASVVDTEMEDGMVLLSLRKAVKENELLALTHDFSTPEGILILLYSFNKEENQYYILLEKQFRPAVNGYLYYHFLRKLLLHIIYNRAKLIIIKPTRFA